MDDKRSVACYLPILPPPTTQLGDIDLEAPSVGIPHALMVVMSRTVDVEYAESEILREHGYGFVLIGMVPLVSSTEDEWYDPGNGIPRRRVVTTTQKVRLFFRKVGR